MGSGLSLHANYKKNIPVLQCSLYSSQINFSRRNNILGAFVEEENWGREMIKTYSELAQ